MDETGPVCGHQARTPRPVRAALKSYPSSTVSSREREPLRYVFYDDYGALRLGKTRPAGLSEARYRIVRKPTRSVMDTGELANSRFILIEDEWLLAQNLAEELADLNCEVVGRATNFAEAIVLANSADYDAAIVDLNLAGESTVSLIEKLWKSDRSVLVVSGMLVGSAKERIADVPFLDRPYTFLALKEAIKLTIRLSRTRRTRLLPTSHA